MNTSQQAYDTVKPVLPSLRQQVQTLIENSGEAGLTASEIISRTGVLDYSIRPRLTELRKLGTITKAGTRPNSRGSNEVVWTLAA